MAEQPKVTAGEAMERLRHIVRSLEARSALVVMERRRDKDLSLTQLTLNTDLRDEFLRSDILATSRLADMTLVEYQAARTVPDGHVMWTPISRVSLLQDLPIYDESNHLLAPFGPRSLQDHSAKMTVTTAGHASLTDEDPVMFFRITADISIIARKGRFNAVFRDGAFSRLDSDVLTFKEDIDAVAAFGFVFFTKKGQFERAFKFLQEMKKQAGQTFDEVISTLRIEGMDDFRRAATNDINMATKMASIKRKLDAHPKYRRALTMSNLLRFLDRNPDIGIETTGTGNRRALVFRTKPSSRFKILKLLDDDFLASELTTLSYLVDSKGDPIGPN
jgi:hypothetical protein